MNPQSNKSSVVRGTTTQDNIMNRNDDGIINNKLSNAQAANSRGVNDDDEKEKRNENENRFSQMPQFDPLPVFINGSELSKLDDESKKLLNWDCIRTFGGRNNSNNNNNNDNNDDNDANKNNSTDNNDNNNNSNNSSKTSCDNNKHQNDNNSDNDINNTINNNNNNNNDFVSFNPSPHLFLDNGELKSKSQLEKESDKMNENNEQYKRESEYQRRRRQRRSRFRSNSNDDDDERSYRKTDIEKALSFVAGAMKCDKVESAFIDDKNRNSKSNNNVNNDNNYNILQNQYFFRHPFIQACEIAWTEHVPLKIDPIHIWLLILQAVALHVDIYSEPLRHKWVQHEGKKKLVVRRDNFVKGLRQHNDWGGVIEEFSDQIDASTVGDVQDTLKADFSNATKIDKIAAKVVIMDICKNYFEYIVRTRCGFPKITLTGTQEDWIKIYNKTKEILDTRVETEFAEKWGKALLPILQRFIYAFSADEKIDCLFWNSMIKRGARRGSGGWEWYSGWINIFFPYIGNKWNEFCEPYSNTQSYIENGLRRAGNGNDINKYPYGLASAPVKWEYFSLVFKLQFIAGFIGVKQDKSTNELTPMVGWLIGEQTKENEQTMIDMRNTFQSNKNLIGSL